MVFLQPSNYNESKCSRQDVIVKDKCLKLRFRAISEFSETQVFDNGTLTIKDFGWSDRGRCTYSSHNFTNPKFSICFTWFFREMVLLDCEKKMFKWSRKTFEIRGWRLRICKIFEITRSIYSNSERSEHFLVTECFFNLFLEVSQI